MKMTKKIISVLLAVMLVLGSVAVAASAEMLTEKAGTVLTYTALVKGKTANADGAIEVEPGEKITVEVYTQTNYYIGSVGSELFAWTDAFFGSLTTADWHLHNHINNYTPNQKYPVTGAQLGSNYKTGYEGFLYGRAYNTNFTTPTDASTPVLSYSFDLTVEAGLADGTTGKFLMPEQMLGLSTANARFRMIYASVASNADVYGTVADASEFPETINVSGAVINFVVKSAEVALDYTELNAQMARFDAEDNTKYTSASWDAAFDAYNVAYETKLDAEATQDDVNAAAAALKAALDNLELIQYCSYTALQQAVNNCSELDSAEEYYDPTDLATWKAALKAAQDLLAADKLVLTDANQAIIDNAAQALVDAYDELYEMYVDTSALSAAIAAYKTPAKAPEFYDSAKYEAWQAALEAAQDGVIDYDGKADTEANRAAVAGLAADLKAAFEALTANYVDTTALAEAIAAYGSVGYAAEYYDAAEYAAWTDALTTANTALNSLAQAADTAENRAAVAEFAADLKAAYEALDARFVDRSALETALALTPAYGEEKYTVTSWAAWQEALANGEDTYLAMEEEPDTESNRKEVADAAKAINDAFDALKLVADKTALAAAIARISALKEDDYTPESWAAADIDSAILVAEEVYLNEDASQTIVDGMVSALERAEAKLVKKADKAALEAAIAAAESLDEADYTPESWVEADLATAIADAKEVYADDNATEAAVADAIQLLRDAALNLVEKADKTALKAAIDTLPEVAEDEATSATWADYEAALAAAQEVYADDNATQDAVNAAEANLLAAIAGVKALGSCDYADLDDAIALIPEYPKEYYDAQTWAAYEAALDAAKAVERDMLADEAGANQKVIDDAAAALVNAYSALVPSFVDRSALEQALALTPEYSAEYYDAAAYAAWQDAVTAGRDTYDAMDGEADTESNREEVATAADAITAAFRKLIPAFIDYSALEEAVAAYGETPEEADAYTPETYEPYAAALERAQNMLNDKNENAPASDTQLQAAIDAAAAELESTYNGLELKPEEPPVEPEEPTLTIVTAVRSTEEFYEVGDTVNFEFDCAITNVTKLQIVFANGSTLTYHRAHSSVVSIVDNGNGTETWTIAVPIYHDNMDASARGKLDKVWEDEGFEFAFETKTETSEEDFKVKSAEVLLNDVAVSEFTAKDTVILKIVCGPDTLRIRLVDQTDGGTSTYDRSRATQDENGNWVWAITRTFAKREYKYDIYTAGSSNRPTDEGTDLVFTVSDKVAVNGPSTGNNADIVVSAAVAKARLVRDAEQTFTIVTDKNAKGVRVDDQYGNVLTYSKDVATATDNGDGTLTWTIKTTCTVANTFDCTVYALYGSSWMNNGTTVSYRVVY